MAVVVYYDGVVVGIGQYSLAHVEAKLLYVELG